MGAMGENEALQTFIVKLPARQARRALTIVNRPGAPYSSISELLSVALENQLGLDLTDEPRSSEADTGDVGPMANGQVHATGHVSGFKGTVTAAAQTGTLELLIRREWSRRRVGLPLPPSAEPLSSFT